MKAERDALHKSGNTAPLRSTEQGLRGPASGRCRKAAVRGKVKIIFTLTPALSRQRERGIDNVTPAKAGFTGGETAMRRCHEKEPASLLSQLYLTGNLRPPAPLPRKYLQRTPLPSPGGRGKRGGGKRHFSCFCRIRGCRSVMMDRSKKRLTPTMNSGNQRSSYNI